MTQINQILERPIDWEAVIKRMLIGSGIGLALISFFVFQVNDPDPEWGKLWRVRPLIVCPLAGAAGGAFSYMMHYISYQGGWRSTVASIVSIVVFIIGIWLGFVLGLVGTLWH